MVGSSACVDSILKINPTNFKLAEDQCDLTRQVRLTDSNCLSCKSFTQKEALSLVVEILETILQGSMHCRFRITRKE